MHLLVSCWELVEKIDSLPRLCIIYELLGQLDELIKKPGNRLAFSKGNKIHLQTLLKLTDYQIKSV